MNKKSILTVFLILMIPLVLFFFLTANNNKTTEAIASYDKPQIIKFSSTMCLECQQVEKAFKELLPKYGDKFVYTSVIVDNRDDMNNELIRKYDIKLVPTVIMLNSDGTQSKRIEAAVPKAQLEKYIKELK